MILAFDTSSALTSVAVVDGQHVVAEASHLDARRHAEVLAPLLADVIAGIDPAGIDAIAWQVPVHGICSLDAVAAAALGPAPPADGLSIALDARRKEVYWARYAADGQRLEGPRVASPSAIDPVLRSGAWAGHGAVIHAEAFGHVLAVASDEASGAGYPQAAWIGRRASALLAAGVTQALAEVPLDAHGDDSGSTAQALGSATLLPPRPLYLRRPDAVAARA